MLAKRHIKNSGTKVGNLRVTGRKSKGDIFVYQMRQSFKHSRMAKSSSDKCGLSYKFKKIIKKSLYNLKHTKIKLVIILNYVKMVYK